MCSRRWSVCARLARVRVHATSCVLVWRACARPCSVRCGGERRAPHRSCGSPPAAAWRTRRPSPCPGSSAAPAARRAPEHARANTHTDTVKTPTRTPRALIAVGGLRAGRPPLSLTHPHPASVGRATGNSPAACAKLTSCHSSWCGRGAGKGGRGHAGIPFYWVGCEVATAAARHSSEYVRAQWQGGEPDGQARRRSEKNHAQLRD